MVNKTLPVSEMRLREIVDTFETPFHLYDESAIRQSAQRLNAAFAWCEGFQEFFAVKATPNPHVLELLKQESVGADCSSLAELVLCEAVGIQGEDIMFTSNNTQAADYIKARELGALINLDDITQIEFLDQHAGLPDVICLRYNPGSLREGNAIIGEPEQAKYGLTRPQLWDAYRALRERGVSRFGLHTMVASNELRGEFFVETARMLFEIAVELQQDLGVRLEFCNLGGGIGIPYRPDQEPVDLESVGERVRTLYDQMIRPAGLHPLRVVMENGRMITGPSGYLVTRAIHHKHIYKDYVGVDACMANLMRPGMYGAYHHITVVGKEREPHEHVVDGVGSLCENNDKFAVDRRLPEVERGDILVIHDTGAHGHAMGFQYNGKLRSAELLLQSDGQVRQIRRGESLADYFATLDYPGLNG